MAYVACPSGPLEKIFGNAASFKSLSFGLLMVFRLLLFVMGHICFVGKAVDHGRTAVVALFFFCSDSETCGGKASCLVDRIGRQACEQPANNLF